MSSISSIVLKNVVDELQKNVQAEMHKFQLQIGALDSILRHSESDNKHNDEQINTIGINLRITNLQLDNDDIHKKLYKLQEDFIKKCDEVVSLKKIVEGMQDKFTQLLEMSTKMSIDFNNHYIMNEQSHNEIDNRVIALNSKCDEFIKNKSTIDKEVFTIDVCIAPYNTPENTIADEPDIVDEDELNKHTIDEEEVGMEEVEEEEVRKEEVEEEVRKEEVRKEEVEEEEEEEMEEIEYKGKTYYIDSDNIAYILNEEGELEEDPVGQWVPEKKIMRFYKK